VNGFVWVSSVMSDYSIGDKQGIREKFYGEDWAPPTFQLGVASKQVLEAHRPPRPGCLRDWTGARRSLKVPNKSLGRLS